MIERQRTVLVTRPIDKAGDFISLLEEKQIRTIHVPMIEIRGPELWDEVDNALWSLEKYAGIIFTSANAVAYFFKHVHSLKIRPSDLPSCYAVGEKTGNAITGEGGKCEIIPETYNGSDLTRSLGNVQGKTFLLPQSNISRDEIHTLITDAGGYAVRVTTYRTVLPEQSEIDALKKKFADGDIDCITFFSPSAVQNFYSSFPDFDQNAMLCAVIGETTAAAAHERKLRVDIISPRATSEAMAVEIIHHLR